MAWARQYLHCIQSSMHRLWRRILQRIESVRYAAVAVARRSRSSQDDTNETAMFQETIELSTPTTALDDALVPPVLNVMERLARNDEQQEEVPVPPLEDKKQW